jgi:L-threonylcarbamoyladenylate synthase
VSGTLDARDVASLRDCLSRDGVALIPTDTVYGLACGPDSPRAVARLYELKGRPPAKPAAVMFFAVQPAMDALPELGERTRAALRALLPGPVTLLLPNPQGRFPLACARADGDPPRPLGLRVPALHGQLAPLASLEGAVMQSSANLSGGPDPRRLAEVPAQLRDGVGVALDGGELPGVASTVIDLCRYELTGEWRVVRDGLLDEPSARAALSRS